MPGTAVAGEAHDIVCVVGARPNFIKMAPILRALGAPQHGLRPRLIHTGQHYDVAMNQRFFEQLEIPAPEQDLGVGSGSHARQTAEVMLRFDPVLDALAPAAVLVVGDVNSTLACALVAAKRGVAVIHVEAGLRSGDMSMPEEVNRILTDRLATLLFTTERAAADNLRREGIAPGRVHFAGNVMIDTLFAMLPRACAPADTLIRHGADPELVAGDFAVMTLHRPATVDDPAVLGPLLEAIRDISDTLPVVFAVHPRTQAALRRMGWAGNGARLLQLPPLGYLEMLGLVHAARVVLTDSGGLQEETTALQVPCLTLRDTTERPITLAMGSNRLVGTAPDAILDAAATALRGSRRWGCRPEGWDGQAAVRVAAAIGGWVHGA